MRIVILSMLSCMFFLNGKTQSEFKIVRFDSSYYCESQKSFINDICDSLQDGIYYVFENIDKKGNYSKLLEIISYSNGKRNGLTTTILYVGKTIYANEYLYKNGNKTDSAFFYQIKSETKDTIMTTKGAYCNDTTCGIWKTYNEKNELVSIVYFLNNGLKHGPWIIYENGQAIIKEEYYYGRIVKK